MGIPHRHLGLARGRHAYPGGAPRRLLALPGEGYGQAQPRRLCPTADAEGGAGVKVRVFWGHFAESEYRRVVVKAIDFRGNEMARALY